MAPTLAYRSSGNLEGKTILFLHGGGVAGWMWDPVVASLQDFHCLVIDLPEHGESMSIRPFSIELAAQVVGDLVHSCAQGGKAILVGMSEGAQVGVQMLASTPQLIDKAIISSALLKPMGGRKWLSSPRLLAWMFRLSVPPFRNNDWWMRLNMKYNASMPEEFFPQYRQNFRLTTEEQFVHIILENQAFRMPDGLEQVTTPVLAIAGKREFPVMRESARELADRLPNGSARVIDLGAHASMAMEHNWMMNAPELFAETVRDFILERELPAALEPLA